MVRQVETMAEFDRILQEAAGKLVAVDFTASWCGPCQMIGPVFVSLSEQPEYKDVVFLKVDVDDAQDVAARYQIRAMPTFIFIKGGEPVFKFEGADKNKLKDALDRLK